MLGKRSDQKGLWEADRLYLDYVGKDTFYGLLASLRGQLFSDDDFAEIYCPDNGRDSVPPSLLATALLLQTYDKVREVFEGSLRLARQSGYLKKRGMRVALDTTYILGRGAVKDTYNLLADGIVKLLRVLAAVANIAVGNGRSPEVRQVPGLQHQGRGDDWTGRTAKRGRRCWLR